MHAGKDYNLVVRHCIDHAVGKSAQQNPPDFAENLPVSKRMSFDCGDGDVNCAKKIRAEAFAAFFVPFCRFDKLGFRFRAKQNSPGHPTCDHNLARTSCQDNAEDGSFL